MISKSSQNIIVALSQCHPLQIIAFMVEDRLKYLPKLFHSTTISSGTTGYYLLLDILIIKFAHRSRFSHHRVIYSKLFPNIIGLFCTKNFYKNITLSSQKFTQKLGKFLFQELSLTLKFTRKTTIKWW